MVATDIDLARRLESSLFHIFSNTRDLERYLPILTGPEKRALRVQIKQAIERLDGLQVACLE